MLRLTECWQARPLFADSMRLGLREANQFPLTLFLPRGRRSWKRPTEDVCLFRHCQSMSR
jgi:hypothetical protein